MVSAHLNSGIPSFSQEQQAYLARLQQKNPEASKAVNQGVHPICALMAQGGQTKAEPPKVGELVKSRGVYLGKYAGLAAYAADDFLRDGNGEQKVLNFNEACAELTLRNGGRSYGNGTEEALRQAIKTGAYRDGDLVLPPKVLLNGRNSDGDKTRPGENVTDLLNQPAFNKIRETISNGSDDGCWAVSSSEHPVKSSGVGHVRLAGGYDYWTSRHGGESGVVPVRFYTPAHTPGG